MSLFQKRNKYHNKSIVIDGIKFDSKAEATRWSELRLLERAKEISDLQLQVKFVLQEGFSCRGKKHRPITYTVDFTYANKSGEKIAEDKKGFATEVYRIKRKLFEFKYGSEWVFLET